MTSRLMERLEHLFYKQPTLEVTEQLLGKIFVHVLPGNLQLKGRIVESC